MADFIVVAVIIMIVLSAVMYIVRAKKKGQVCIGCPNAANCSKNCKTGTKRL